MKDGITSARGGGPLKTMVYSLRLLDSIIETSTICLAPALSLALDLVNCRS